MDRWRFAPQRLPTKRSSPAFLRAAGESLRRARAQAYEAARRLTGQGMGETPKPPARPARAGSATSSATAPGMERRG